MWCHASYTAVEASLPLTLPAILEEAQLDCDQDNLDEILDDDAIDSDKPSTSSSTAVLRDPMTREFVFAIPLAARVERGYDARYSEVVRGTFKTHLHPSWVQCFVLALASGHKILYPTHSQKNITHIVPLLLVRLLSSISSLVVQMPPNQNSPNLHRITPRTHVLLYFPDSGSNSQFRFFSVARDKVAYTRILSPIHLNS